MRSVTKFVALGYLALPIGCTGGSTGPSVGEQTIEITPARIDTLFSIGDTVRLDAISRDGAGRVLADVPITFESSETGVATVSSDGILVSTGNGSAIITARSNVASASVTAEVRQKVAKVVLVPGSARLAVSATAEFTATPADARDVAIAGLPKPTYSSSDTSVATASPAGTVTAIAVGTAVVTASVVSPADGARAGTAEITVTQVQPNAMIGMTSDTFVPAVVDIARSGTVTFVNDSGILHDVDFGIQGLYIPVHGSGQHTRAFPNAGTFAFHCNLHAGMSGTVFVH